MIEITEKEFYHMRKRAGVCVKCGKEDAFTIAGRVRCFDCSEKERVRKVQYRKDDGYAEKERWKRKRKAEKRIEANKCPLCGRDNISEFKYCQYCRSKEKFRHREIRKDKSFTRGTFLCWQCNKEEPMPGKKLCPECYKVRIACLAKANEARRKRNEETWNG